MPDFGVIDEGFREKTLSEILEELQDAEKAAFGPAINTQADSVLGQLNGIVADQLAQLWEVALGVYRSLYPDSASGEALDQVAAITGAVRLPQTKSTVDLKLLLESAATVTAGSLVSIGESGEQWEILAEVENAGADRAYVDAEAESSNFGAIVGNASAIDTIQTPIAGWSAQAAVLSQSVEPFALEDGLELTLIIDGGDEQTVTFDTADFVDITAATAAEVAAAISAAITGGVAEDHTDGAVMILSDTDGTGSIIQVTGGDANPILGFPGDEFQGMNWSTPARSTSVAVETFTLVDAQTLTVKIDGGGTQTFTFNTADFVDIANALAWEVAAKIQTTITGGRAYANAGSVTIETDTIGVNGSVEITGGAANAALNFDEEVKVGTAGDATVGRETETDAAFRLRREELIRLAGAGTLEAIRAAIRDVDDVNQVSIYENPTDTTDINGLPPHSFEAVVSGGTDADIAETIFETKPVGIQTYRDPGPDGVTETVTDSQGFTHDINFSRPTDVDMWIIIDVTVSADDFGGGDEDAGVLQVQEALKEHGDTLVVGDDVIINHFMAQAFEVTGVTDVTAIKIEDTNPPVNTSNITMGVRELALFSTARITVNVS